MEEKIKEQVRQLSQRTIIYNRTSTTEQNPENQLKDCLEVIKRLNLTDYEILEEQKSAFKDEVEREVFNSIIDKIKKRQLDNLICWDLDRLYRDRKKLVAFFELCKLYNCKIYSFRQQFLEDINKAPAPWNEMLFNQLIFILGWISEEESIRRSMRIKASVRNEEGVTKSRKGNKWGRRKKPVNKEYILELHKQGLSSYKIAKKYSDDPRFKAKISHQTVYNIIKKHTE